MVVVLVVAGLTGWMAHVIRTQREAIAAVRASGGRITFDWTPRVRSRPSPTGPAVPAWLRRSLGDELFQTVEAVSFERWATPAAVAALGQFGDLKRVFFNQTEPIAGDLTVLRHHRRLEFLTIPASATTDAVLLQVAQLGSLRELSLVGSRLPRSSPATDDGFASLARLPNLTHLMLVDCGLLTDDGAAQMVAGLPELRELAIRSSGLRVTRFLPNLAHHHPDLRVLNLREVAVHNDDLAALAGLTHLEALVLPGTVHLGDAGLAHLRTLVQLKHLTLSGTRVTDAGLAHLSGLTHLEYLSLSGTAVSDAGLAHLSGLTRLKDLFVDGTGITDAGLATLARLPALEQLSLNGDSITDAGLLTLAKFPRLATVHVITTPVTPEGVDALQQAAPQIRQVTTRARTVAATPVAAPTLAPRGK